MSDTVIRRTRIALACLVLALSLAACGSGGHDAHGNFPGGFPPATVKIAEVAPRDLPVQFEYPAQTAGFREVEVRARVAGILLERNYQEGSAVKAGESLFKIDPAAFEAEVARAEADVASADARMRQTTRQSERLKPLFEARASSQKDFDDAVSAGEIASADLKAAQARLAEAKLRLSYTTVHSPVNGLTSRSMKSEGSLISGPEVLLTTVTQVDPIYVNFGLSEWEQSKLRTDVAAGTLVLPEKGVFDVAIRFQDGSEYAQQGHLEFTDVRVNPATGTSDARAQLPNVDGVVRPGQFVRILLKGAYRPNAISIPQKAVMEGPHGKYVYVVGAENKAEMRPVVMGDWVGAEWIVLSGLQAGDKLIVDGLMKVMPGAPVQVADPNANPNAVPPDHGKHSEG